MKGSRENDSNGGGGGVQSFCETHIYRTLLGFGFLKVTVTIKRTEKLLHLKVDMGGNARQGEKERNSLLTFGLGCPSKLVSIRNNRNWNRNQFRHYPKQNVCFSCFASIPKQRVSMFRLNRNKQKTNRNSLIGSIFCYFLQKI